MPCNISQTRATECNDGYVLRSLWKMDRVNLTIPVSGFHISRGVWVNADITSISIFFFFRITRRGDGGEQISTKSKDNGPVLDV